MKTFSLPDVPILNLGIEAFKLGNVRVQLLGLQDELHVRIAQLSHRDIGPEASGGEKIVSFGRLDR